MYVYGKVLYLLLCWYKHAKTKQAEQIVKEFVIPPNV